MTDLFSYDAAQEEVQCILQGDLSEKVSFGGKSDDIQDNGLPGTSHSPITIPEFCPLDLIYPFTPKPRSGEEYRSLKALSCPVVDLTAT